MSTRMNININDETANALKRLAQERGTSVTEIVRRSVSVYAYVEDQLSDGSKELQILDRSKDETTKLALL